MSQFLPRFKKTLYREKKVERLYENGARNGTFGVSDFPKKGNIILTLLDENSKGVPYKNLRNKFCQESKGGVLLV
jgi:hypothetical protein